MMGMALTLVHFKPFKDRQQNRLEIMNEYGLYFIVAVSYVFTPYLSSVFIEPQVLEQSKVGWGWFVVACIGAIICIN